jgi:hypothetical protein
MTSCAVNQSTPATPTPAPRSDSVRVYYEVDVGSGRISDTETEPDSWILYIQGVYGVCKFTYVVYYPNKHSVEDWEALADGKRNLECYQGNGGGGFRVVGATIEFNANPSGGGGDVDLTVSLPLAVIAGPLRAAIRAAAAEGLQFSE